MYIKNHTGLRQALMFSVLAGGFVVSSYFANIKIQSANLTNVSVTLTNSRLSFRGALGSGNTVGSSIVTINDTQNAYPSTSSAQLVEGDVVSIGSSGVLNNYSVASTSSLSTFTITSGLASGDTESGDDVISTQSGSLYVRFTTANAIADGEFRVLVPAVDNTSAAADGIPDGGFWDFGTTAPVVTCPGNETNYTFSSGTANASSVLIDGQYYHSFGCAYTGAGGVGDDFDGSSFGYMEISGPLNPAPRLGHSTGTADTHNLVVQHLNSTSDVIDSTSVAVGVIEAVKVTATVAPQLSFQIIGINAGSTASCGVTTSVATTPASVPFGELYISNFKYAAQTLAVSTNASNGFIVTTTANDQMGLNGAACAGADGTGSNSCIPDPEGGSTAMSPTVEDSWSNSATTDKGFAYSLDNNNTTAAFTYNQNTGNCTGSDFCARQFPDTAASEAPSQIFSAAGPADNQNLDVCYKAIVSATTAAGNYENHLTYTATATF